MEQFSTYERLAFLELLSLDSPVPKEFEADAAWIKTRPEVRRTTDVFDRAVTLLSDRLENGCETVIMTRNKYIGAT
jgi:hypothetical protein